MATGPRMKVTILLADAAEAVNGKLYILGGGWSVTGPGPVPSALAIKIEVPWDQANQRHDLQITLLDADGHAVNVPTPAGDVPLELKSQFEVGRPAGLVAGTPLDVALAVNLGLLPLRPGRRYVWRCTIDGDTHEDWQVAFSTREQPQQPAVIGP
jgi:hypothetical protein